MKTIKLFVASSLILLGVASASAQDFRTGYFLGGYQYAYRMNPAFPSEHNFFSLGLGQFGANIQSDFGFSDFVKKDASGQYVIFLNDAISSEDFLSGFKKDELNKLDISTNLNIISRGSWNKEKRSFSTFDVSIKSTNSLALPYDLFRFLKEGSSAGSNFDFSGTSVSSKNFLELAYGTTRIVKNTFNFGLRLKGLVGLANASMTMDNLKVIMASDQWSVTSKGTLEGSVPFADLGVTDDGKYYDYKKVSLNPGKLAKNLGLGGAVDAGLAINLVPWLTVSAAILDFGVVNWVNEIYGEANSSSIITPSADSNADQMSQFVSSLQDIYKFEPKTVDPPAKTLGGKWEQLPYRINGGVELRVPFYQRLSVGALYTMYGNNFAFNTDDLLLSVNWTPINFLSVSGSTRLGDKFQVFGAAVNLHPSLFNLFVGIDAVNIPLNLINIGPLLGDKVPASVKPYCIMPADDLNLNAYVGLSFALGKRQIDYRKMSKAIIKEQKEKAEQKALEKKEKEEQKAKEKELKEYEKLQAEEAKAADKKAKEDAKAAKIAEKEAAAQAKADEKAAKEQAAAEAKAAKEAAAKAKADAKAAKEAEKAAKAQEKAAKAAEKAAAKNAELEAATAKMEAEKAAKAAEEEAAKAAAEVTNEATEAESLLESVLENKTEEPAPVEEPKAEEPKAEEPAKEETAPVAPTVFEFPNL